MEYVGRKDNQVKIRGHRIELGEIEAALRSHPAVKEAVVSTGKSAAGELRLIAWILCEGTSDHLELELKRWLAERLPEVMIPSQVTVLETLPLNSNGKIDRELLGVMQSQLRKESRAKSRETFSPLEEQIAQIWSEFLDTNDFGPNDSFFEIGGHSLSAIQMASRLRDTFGIEVKLQQFFDLPTIAGLAKLASAAAVPAPSSTPIPRRPRGNHPIQGLLSELNAEPLTQEVASHS